MRKRISRHRWIQIFCCMITLLVNNYSAFALDPESSSGYVAKERVVGYHHMVVAANPLAAQAGYDVLEAGGTAIDAAIAVQMVLNVVEPQSSGVGGGGFLLYYDASNEELLAYDGREVAPSAVSSSLFLDKEGQPITFMEAVRSGKSVGVPGLLKMLKQAHQDYGTSQWSTLFEPAIHYARYGFLMSPRLHTMLASAGSIDALQMYYHNDALKPVGSTIYNPMIASLFERIAAEGIDPFYHGDIADRMIHVVNEHGGVLNKSDMEKYQVKMRDPLCRHIKSLNICGMPPPSSGPLTIIQILGMLEYFKIGQFSPYSFDAVHLLAETSRLAFADRNTYIADPDMTTSVAEAMLRNDYLRQRVSAIGRNRAMKQALPGHLSDHVIMNEPIEGPSTTHISIVDHYGNAVSMTTSIEHGFGSGLMVDGFFLNNQLTDFSFQPVKDGKLVANRVEPLKRPRSSMSPLIAFNDTHQPVLILGSPGGARIIPYVLHTLLLILEWNYDIHDAIHAPRVVHIGQSIELEAGQGLESLVRPLKRAGHDVSVRAFSSGLHGIMMKDKEIIGAADPRREGIAIGR